MTVTTGFWIALAATLVCVAATLRTGFLGRRRAHFVLAPASVALLALTIVLAERMGRARLFPPAEMRIHLAFAKSAALLVLPAAVTGLMLVRRPGWRRAHVACVALFLLVTAVALGTGAWVYSLSTPR
ncbi:MAG: hypothetical protein IT458_14955 [Planctomycetes bacterium]|nr:hypothetical protein [Planctomycetota bacterium]